MTRYACSCAAVLAFSIATASADSLTLQSRALTQSATRTVYIPPLPIEQHGFDDVDMWPQGLLKGVRWWKTDWSFCSRSSCDQFSTWGHVPGRGNASDCFINSDGQELCCICLRGDASSRPNLTSPFNTSYDVLAFLADPGHTYLYPAADSATPVMLGMDWGGPSVDLLSGPAAPVLQQLFLTLNATIASRGLGLRPYFDAGTSGWFNELDNKCASGQCNAAELQLQALPWPSEAGDALPMSGDPFGRYQILNSDQLNFAADCASASWNVSESKADAYPYLWYEPSSQIEYIGFMEAWQNCVTTPPDKRDLNTGITIVSNQASEMFEVYSSFLLGRGLDSMFLNSSFKQPRMALINAQTHLYPSFDRFALVLANSAGGSQLLLTGITDGRAPNASDIIDTTPVQVHQGIVSLHVYDAGMPLLHPLILVSDASGMMTVYIFNATTGRMLQQNQVQFSAGNGDATLLSASWVCTPYAVSATECLIAALAQDASSTYVSVLNVGAAGAVEVVATAMVQGAINVTSGSISLTPAWANITSSPPHLNRRMQPAEVLVGVQGVAVFAAPTPDGRSYVYAAFVEVNVTVMQGLLYNVTLGVENDGAANQPGLTPTRIGFGSAPHVHTASFDGQIYVLVTNTDGLCQCGLLMNNDDTPHCLLPTSDADGNPFLRDYQSVPYLLNYNYGELDAFRAAVQQPATTPFSMCSPSIMSGKFENGLSPSGALYVRQVVYTNTTCIAAPDGCPSPETSAIPALSALFLHDGDVICPIITTAFCGSPLPKPGLVFDQFEIVQPSRLAAGPPS